MKRKLESERTEPTGSSKTSAPAEKKRRSGKSVDVPSTRRTIRSQRPSLSIEMVAKVASFANYGDDLMNICLAVGPKDANIVRHVCLRNNMNYLRRVLERTIARKRDGGLSNFHIENERIKEWMLVNPDWRKYCTKERVVDEKYCKASFRDEHGDGTMVYSSDPLIIFNNPAVAIEFNAVAILKYLVENVGIDINAHNWAGLAGEENDSNKHLLCVAETRATIKYLLSRNELNVCAPIEKGGGVTLSWHILLVFVTRDIFDSVIQHESFNVNGLNEINEIGLPNLLMAIIVCFGGDDALYGPLELRLGNIQCMLDAGADPEQEITGLPISTPLQYIRSELRKEAEGSTKAKTWQRVIQMMEAAVAARNEIGSN